MGAEGTLRLATAVPPVPAGKGQDGTEPEGGGGQEGTSEQWFRSSEWEIFTAGHHNLV